VKAGKIEAPISASQPCDAATLAEIHGLGPAFLKRHADDVLALVAAQVLER
jgi:hypothetical protein